MPKTLCILKISKAIIVWCKTWMNVTFCATDFMGAFACCTPAPSFFYEYSGQFPNLLLHIAFSGIGFVMLLHWFSEKLASTELLGLPLLYFDVPECISVLATSFNPRTLLLLIDLFKVFNFVLHINQKNVILFYYDTIFLIVQVSGNNSEKHPNDLLLSRLCCKYKLQ